MSAVESFPVVLDGVHVEAHAAISSLLSQQAIGEELESLKQELLVAPAEGAVDWWRSQRIICGKIFESLGEMLRGESVEP